MKRGRFTELVRRWVETPYGSAFLRGVLTVLVCLRVADAITLIWAKRFAHAFQRWTGYTSFFLAKGGVVIWVIANFVDIANYFHPLLTPPTDVFNVVFSFLIVIELSFRVHWLTDADTKAQEGSEARSLPRWVGIYRAARAGGSGTALRMLFVFFLLSAWPLALAVAVTRPFWPLGIVRSLWTPGIVIFEYFIMVDPLPPGTSKIRQFLSWRRPVAVPS